MSMPSSDFRQAGTGVHAPSDRDGIVERLLRASRFEDPAARRAEEQAFLPTPDGPIFVTLVEPLGDRRDVAFLICHSFAFEQLDLFPLELAFARRAASAGFPTLYFQARGYADSGGDLAEATPATHLRDALAAAGYLRRLSGVEAIVPAGARWGAGVALMAAGRLESPGVVLWNPALEPGAYLDGLLKVFSRSRIAGKGRGPDEPAAPTREQLQATLSSNSEVDLFGFPLSPRCYREATSMGSVTSAERVPPKALLVVVNPRTDAEARVAAERLRDLGSDVRLEQAEGPRRAQFGLGASPAGRYVVTSQPLFQDVSRRTIAWADELWPARRGPSPVARTTPDGVRSDPTGAEVPVYVRSRGDHLGAVVAIPDDRDSSVGVVLLASRARDRAHRNGLWVKTSRTLAEDGMYVLRLDYPGVGNSSGAPTIFGFKDMPSASVEDACRFLVEHTPVRRILLAGTCYGGRVVLDAASRIPEVAGVALVVAPVLRPLSRTDKIRLKAARFLGRGATWVRAPEQPTGRPVAAPAPHRRVDPGFSGALKRFLPRGRVYFLYGEQDLYWRELRFALDRLRLPEDRYEVDLVPGEIDSFRSLAMQSITHERLSAWCRRSAEALREPA